MSIRDARVYMCTRVLYTTSYRVYTFTKLHDRRIPIVGVGIRVGPMEFQLYPHAGSAFSNRVTLTFDFLTLGLMNAERLPCTVNVYQV